MVSRQSKRKRFASDHEETKLHETLILGNTNCSIFTGEVEKRNSNKALIQCI